MIMSFPPNLLVGTSSWSTSDWVGPFYPAHLKPGQFIEAYARKFPAVEIDSTYYSIPPPQVVAGWRDKTPPGFVFTAKIPGVVTHEKVLQDCQAELTAFLQNISLLGDRLGPLLLQFPYFNKNAFPSRQPFEKLLRPFLAALPKEFKFALEIRNKNWLSWDFLELLRDHSVAFALVAQAWMPRIDTLAKALDLVTSDFAYVRFIGDRKGIEAKTAKWDRLIEDKTPEMTVWVHELKKIVNQGVKTYAFFNNHYAGFAPGSVKLFEDLWDKN
ncbi:MAG TPA: DUF72 domain-containing protein [Verrucomicrobiae bacterium]|nr:DUF72 domain-containing protein [Verrucomicrobiae bacterium]